MNFGIVLNKSGQTGAAEDQFRRSIGLDPSLKQAYVELAKLYAAQGRAQDVNDTIDRFLKFNPQDIMFRLQKSSSARGF